MNFFNIFLFFYFLAFIFGQSHFSYFGVFERPHAPKFFLSWANIQVLPYIALTNALFFEHFVSWRSFSLTTHFHPMGIFVLFLNLFLHFIQIMRQTHRTTDLFGAPEAFSGSQLPTFSEVGKQWRFSKQVLETKHPGRIVSKWDIAREVIKKETRPT